MNKMKIVTRYRNYIKKKILELKDTINELKNSLEWFNSRLD